ncbi:hypothetical protein [Sulfobacillus thermosulfidooxidans]|uniref:hypothetical protein n=1 Tax=Sulfobacillus thermosulfidooxidans TaxID=28034 RepID=UPI00096B8EFC|nr:hypothetical protein [Sulfobacillus thermosulfidooxidans]OLZ08971.1 hypothetical protein BFX05_01845 [Sulfobacillus thermosulfidooxidans]OLZ14157.1 hypothetical protein BFX06_07615 [Sulfobacillus thermosulfidooxidans]OLZ18900.1 hypothetical protein BFX07_04010 [Sulfobacillus thermosulfidooxidans]
MRHKRSKRFTSILGVAISILLPIVVLEVWTSHVTSGVMVARFIAEFILAVLAVQVGIVLWKPRSSKMIIEDVLIAAASGIGAFIAAKLSIAQGGAPVDPGLLALLTAYILWLWPHPHRRL